MFECQRVDFFVFGIGKRFGLDLLDVPSKDLHTKFLQDHPETNLEEVAAVAAQIQNPSEQLVDDIP